MKLYKYGKVNKFSEAVFSTPNVFLESPGLLNDPFECRPLFTFDGSRDDYIDFLSTMVGKHEGCSEEQAKEKAKGIYDAGAHKMPQSIESYRRGILNLLVSSIGLYCMSERYDSLLMWSHYAGSHSGYCIEFEASVNTPLFGEAQKVNYSGHYPTVDFFNTPKDEQVDPIFLTKSVDWKYEREWRIINHTHGRGEQIYPSHLMKRVICGIRMLPEHRNAIEKWLLCRSSEVEICEAVQHTSEFRISVRGMDDLQ